jgi:hypothetical protein
MKKILNLSVPPQPKYRRRLGNNTFRLFECEVIRFNIKNMIQ